MTNTLKINFKGMQFESPVITVGVFMDLELTKAQLSKGRYGQMLSNMTVNSNEALTMIDTMAAIEVLFPELKKKAITVPIENLGIKDWVDLKNMYIDQIVPYLNQLNQLLNPPKKGSDDSKEDSQKG